MEERPWFWKVTWHPFAFHWVVGSLGSSGSGVCFCCSGGVGFCRVAWLPFVFHWSSAGGLTAWGLPALGGRASSQGARSCGEWPGCPSASARWLGSWSCDARLPARWVGCSSVGARRPRGAEAGLGASGRGQETILGVPEIPSPTPPRTFPRFREMSGTPPQDIFAISQDVDFGSVRGLRHFFDIFGTF